jgi:hypothetical protein
VHTPGEGVARQKLFVRITGGAWTCRLGFPWEHTGLLSVWDGPGSEKRQSSWGLDYALLMFPNAAQDFVESKLYIYGLLVFMKVYLLR